MSLVAKPDGPADRVPVEEHESAGTVASPVLPLSALDRDSLSVAGGKAANLGEMLRAGLPVPGGFCVTTEAYALVAADADLGTILADLAGTAPTATDRLAQLATAARERILSAPLPETLATAIGRAYDELGASVPVAVRSSATAEDLPFASFAGQQDTYLNIVGRDAVLDAVRRCWASLWTDRAVAYRATNHIDNSTVRLAVVVQRMVDAAVAGVMFTADPLTGRRRRASIDASPGLGEAVVSGAVNPDHFVIEWPSGEVVERTLGDKRLRIESVPGGGTRHVEVDTESGRACLTDSQLRGLAQMAVRLETLYGRPQDAEFAVDATGTLWLTQARPITTLYPLPPSAPADPRDLRVYFSINVAQGVFRPFTPMGVETFRLMAGSIARMLGYRIADPYAGPAAFVEAGHRMFFDVTAPLRTHPGRALILRGTAIAEARASATFEELGADPRLALRPARRRTILRIVSRLMARTRLPLRAVQHLARPAAALERIERFHRELESIAAVPADATPVERLDAAERIIRVGAPRTIATTIPTFPFGFAALLLARRLLGDRASSDDFEIAVRGLPHNPTTEMDLALWRLAVQLRDDAASRRTFEGADPRDLAARYSAGTLPDTMQRGVASFLAEYGHRAVAEIDLGLPRWSEDPSHILGVIANYLRLGEQMESPEAQFRRTTQEAEAMVATLARRAGQGNPLRGWLVRLLLGRARALAGLREMPKFLVVLGFARARAHLLEVARHLQTEGRLDVADDLFFLSYPEVRFALAGGDVRPQIRERRASYEHELARRHVPRILLSDGTEPRPASETADASGALRGSPASTGTVTGPARVILDPVGAHLEPGEILVAPSTDPGWTPLFLTAGGLVMEMGGSMSHGAVVAREYGIPAVVGVPAATERIATGDVITVDGAAGTVTHQSAPTD